MIKLNWTAILVMAELMFLVLSWKDPYGERSLIGNFDPFPDSMYYTVPARNFALGNGFRIWRPEGEIKMTVPILYSLSLIPSYLINSDSRSFYYTNIILGMISVYLLYLISKKVSNSPWITGLVLLLYTGTYVIYWQPQLAMGENILMPILLASILLWLQPLSLKNTFLITVFGVACYGSKYVSLPLTISILGLLSLKIILSKRAVVKQLSVVITIGIISMALMNGSQLVSYLSSLFNTNHSPVSDQVSVAWLSPQYFSNSFPKYFGALMGQPIYNLFSVRPILPPYLAAVVMVWCIYSVIKLPKVRWLSIYILTLVISQLAFLSVIQMVEGRYAFVFLPLIYTGLAAMLGWLLKKPKQQFIFAVIIASIYSFAFFSAWKYQLILNFKASETPWWQIGITKTDYWLNQQNLNNPIVITSFNPFLWDFYRQNHNYQLLPLTESFDFMNYPQVWGLTQKPDNILQYYDAQLDQGRQIYLATVGFNQNQWKIFEAYGQRYTLQLINQDCNNSCRLYKIDLVPPHTPKL